MRRVGDQRNRLLQSLEDERGATALIVTILLLVLFGVGALVLDAGHLVWERRQLQNSADASSLAVAQDCALDAGCEAYAGDTATDYAVANNRRGAHVEELDIDFAEAKVTVVTHTGDQEGSLGFLQHWLIPLLDPSQDEGAARARAVAIWEATPLDGDTAEIPVAGSVCDFIEEYDGGTITPEELDAHAQTLPTEEDAKALIDGGDLGQIVSLHRPNTQDELDDACTVDPGFSTEGGEGAEDPDTMPAGFGFLADDGDCGVLVNRWEDDGTFWARQNPGTSPQAAECIKARVGTVVTIPIFIEVNRADKEYRLYAPAAFYLTGARVTGSGPPAVPSGFTCPAGAEEWCLRGHFVKKVESGSGSSPSTSFGVYSVRLTE